MLLSLFHNYHPTAIIFSWGSFSLHWYGLLLSLGILAGLKVALVLAKKYKLSSTLIIDLSFYLILGGLLGARIYEVFLFFPHYLENPLDIFKVWQGGLAIHGAILGGLIVAFIFLRKKKKDFFKLASILLPGLALGQAIGRWGNYFNQELFGQPTDLPWGIFIDVWNRPLEYINYSYFHPTFLYESLACLAIFLLLIWFHAIIKSEKKFKLITLSYFFLYSVLRFFLEFIKVDTTPYFLGLRWPQIISLIIILATIIVYAYQKKKP